MRLPHRCWLAGLVALAALSPVRAEDKLTPAEAALLKELPDPEATAELAKLADTVQEWKAKFDDAKKLIETYKAQVAAAEKALNDVKGQLNEAQATAMKTVDAVRAAKSFDPKALQALLDIVLPLAKQADLAKKCPPLQAVVDTATKIEAKVKEIEAKVKADIEAKLAEAKKQLADLKADADALKARGEQYKQDVDALANLDEAQLRAMVERAIRAKLQEELLAAVGADALDKLKQFQNPAKFARTFFEGEFKKWIGTPFEITKEIKARVLTEKPGGSLFDPKTELAVEIEYTAGLKVKATGFAIEYDGTKAPFVKPVFDPAKAKLTPDASGLITGALNKLKDIGIGELLPKSLPFTVELKDNLASFRPGTPLRVGVEIDLSKFGLAGKMGGVVKIGPNKLELDGSIKFATALTPPVPLPGMPAVALHEFGGELDVSGPVKRLKAEVTFAGTAPGAAKALAVKASVAVTFPFDAVKVTGKLLVGGQSVCDAEIEIGKLKDGKKGIAVALILPGKDSAIPRAILDGRIDATLTKDGLTANGHLTMYSVFKTKFDLELESGGRGRFTGKWDGNLLGVSADAAVTVDFEPGFKNLAMTANLHVTVNLAAELGDLFNSDLVSASVRVTGDGNVSGTAHGFGMTADFDMRLTDDLPKVLRDKFGKKAKQFIQAVADTLAECDPFAKGSFANQLGKDLDPFNRNGAAGRFVSELGNVKKLLPDIKFDPAKVGGAVGVAADAVKEKANAIFGGAGEGLQQLGNGLQNLLPSPPPAKWPPWGFAPRRDPFDLAVLSAIALAPGDGGAGEDGDFVTALGGAVVSLQYIQFTDAAAPSHTSTPAGRIARGSSVHVRVLAPTLAALDKDTFLIGFTVKASGTAYTIKPGAKPERITNSQLAPGAIRLVRQPGGRWKGTINQPKIAWDKLSYQDAGLRLSQEIEFRLEKIPGVDIDGLRNLYEKALVVRNDAKTDLTVRLQRRTNSDGWKWRPADPPAPKSYEFRLKAGETKELTGRDIGLPTDDPVTANRVRIWAEADDGEDWTDHRGKDYWLVAEDPKKNDARVYVAEKVRKATYSFAPKSGFRTYSERVVGFKNNTEKTIRVHLSYQSTEDGKTTWRTLPQFEVKAGETVQPREPDGPFVRASAVRFAAVSEEFVYRENLDKPLWLVADAGSGVRLYKAEKVGTHTHTFHPAPATKPGGDK